MRAPRASAAISCCAEKKGYAGVALYSKASPDKVVTGFGVKEFDAEGRYLEAKFGRLSVVSVYLPSVSPARTARPPSSASSSASSAT
jgi:exodeoxyribonuclease-3